MAFINLEIEKAKINPHFAFPPYHVETFPIGSCVCNKNGINCLRFENSGGAVFTSEDIAKQICAEWNNETAYAQT